MRKIFFEPPCQAWLQSVTYVSIIQSYYSMLRYKKWTLIIQLLEKFILYVLEKHTNMADGWIETKIVVIIRWC